MFRIMFIPCLEKGAGSKRIIPANPIICLCAREVVQRVLEPQDLGTLCSEACFHPVKALLLDAGCVFAAASCKCTF